MTTLVIIAKEPIAGRAKTRLHPPLSLQQAAQVAAACIDDTVAAMSLVPAQRRILFFDGRYVPSSAADLEFVPQPEGTLDERLAWIFDFCVGPAVLVGMDTPQATAAHLAPVQTDGHEIDAWYGPASDGGFWALGMREPRGDLIRGVPMSREDTGATQLKRLAAAGMRVSRLAQLTDVDTIADAQAVAAQAPHTQFAHELRFALSTVEVTAAMPQPPQVEED